MKEILVAVAIVVGCVQTAVAEGDTSAGQKVFKRCAACHAVEDGKNKVGPTMFGVVGRQAGSLEDYKYSDAMQDVGYSWDEEQLAGFLAAPRKHLPGTKMAFSGLKREGQIIDLIEYLKTLN